jgi:hypothetical protein
MQRNRTSDWDNDVDALTNTLDDDDDTDDNGIDSDSVFGGDDRNVLEGFDLDGVDFDNSDDSSDSDSSPPVLPSTQPAQQRVSQAQTIPPTTPASSAQPGQKRRGPPKDTNSLSSTQPVQQRVSQAQTNPPTMPVSSAQPGQERKGRLPENPTSLPSNAPSTPTQPAQTSGSQAQSNPRPGEKRRGRPPKDPNAVKRIRPTVTDWAGPYPNNRPTEALSIQELARIFNTNESGVITLHTKGGRVKCDLRRSLYVIRDLIVTLQHWYKIYAIMRDWDKYTKIYTSNTSTTRTPLHISAPNSVHHT